MKYFNNNWGLYLDVVEILNYKGILDNIDNDIIKKNYLKHFISSDY
ncbi:hypothetical protein MTP04_19730 [Lysinibacillus sp. PLM2]|nr:hypothetical protein MTP04_19730 [Lysinibacillus sp. PLM2]